MPSDPWDDAPDAPLPAALFGAMRKKRGEKVDWEARWYQKKAWRFLRRGGKRAVLVWHRRAGKDMLALNFTVSCMHKKPGLYWHMLPTATQGRKVLWDGMAADGRRFLDVAIPAGFRRSSSSTEMKIELYNGAIWQIVGSDNYDHLVGSNPIGVVMSEYSLADPAAWDFVRPILAENGGWAIFPFTPRGRNHGYRLYQMARENPGWFAQSLGADYTGAIPPEAIEDERRAGMPEELVQQEFYCSFDASLVGSYYGRAIAAARQEGRIAPVPHDPGQPVHTVWDIGIGDATAIGFVQAVGPHYRFIDYYEASGVGVQHYVRMLQEKAAAGDWVYGRHFAPHDIAHAEWGSGRTRIATARELGIRFEIVPRWSIEDGIQAARNLLPRCWFDESKCDRLVDALTSYRKEWDDRLKLYRERPLHDWSSHGADMFRYFAVGFRDPKGDRRVARQAEIRWDPWSGA